jgi:hypothetical protein
MTDEDTTAAEKEAEDAAASREGIDEITQEDIDALDIEDDDADKDA